MKCEICHKADASEVLRRENAAEDDELYVCADCAKAERLKEKRTRDRVRKEEECSGLDEIQEGLDNLFGDLQTIFTDLTNDLKSAAMAKDDAESMEEHFPLFFEGKVIPSELRVAGFFHAEGLSLIGELDAIERAVHALEMEVEWLMVDAVRDAAHGFRLRFKKGQEALAARVLQDLMREERNARSRLKNEIPRLFSDSVCRALAILKNCRLLSRGDLVDLLSPLRIAVRWKKLEGITAAEIEKLIKCVDDRGYAGQDPDEQDRIAAERADRINKRFEGVFVHDLD